MNFFAQFLTETHFPPEAADFLLGAYTTLGEKGQQEALEGAVETFYAHELDLKLIEPLIGEMAEAAGLSPYTGVAAVNRYTYSLPARQRAVPRTGHFRGGILGHL